jgi:hypothetical protein
MTPSEKFAVHLKLVILKGLRGCVRQKALLGKSCSTFLPHRMTSGICRHGVTALVSGWKWAC